MNTITRKHVHELIYAYL